MKEDVILHQNEGTKKRLKTNPEHHIAHIRDSGVREAIRLLKIWRSKLDVRAKTFVLELLVVKLLDGRAKHGLDEQARHVLETFRDGADTLSVSDPANGSNDLTPLLNEARSSLESAAESTLRKVDSDGWKAVFGELENSSDQDDASRDERLKEAAKLDPVRVRPWLPKR